MAKITASDIVQAVIVLDQAFAAVTNIITNIENIDGADEKALKAQLKAVRQRNDERYAAIEKMLTDRAARK